MARLFDEYKEWSIKNKKDPFKAETVEEFKKYKEENSADGKKDIGIDKIEKQKKIFKMFCDYYEKDVSFPEDKDFAELFDDFIKKIVDGVIIVQKKQEIERMMRDMFD